jgi:hypothetical protein
MLSIIPDSFFKSRKAPPPKKTVYNGYDGYYLLKNNESDIILTDDIIDIESFVNDIFTLKELKKCIKNSTEIEFTYKNEVIKMIPNSISSKTGEDILSAYTEDKGNKKWKRFKVDLIKRV